MATVSRASQSDKLGEVPDNQIKLGLTTTVIGYSATTMAIISTRRRCVMNEFYVFMIVFEEGPVLMTPNTKIGRCRTRALEPNEQRLLTGISDRCHVTPGSKDLKV